MKFSWSIWFSPLSFLIAALIALGIGLILTPTLKQPESYLFEVEVATESAGQIQLFYNLGRGYTEADSATQPLVESPQLRRYRFIVPRGTLLGLRLDPINAIANLTIARPAMVDFQGDEIADFSASDFAPDKQVEVSPIDQDSINVISTGSDPSIQMELPAPLHLDRTLLQLGNAGLVFICLKLFIGCWILIGMLQTFGTSLFQKISQHARRRPIVTIICVGTLAVVIQCHPVIFFGRSFVSPDNGTFLLYDRFPTLPGYVSKGSVDPQGTDIAALYHQSMAYPGLQREALFRFGELPLWNRYPLGGAPLLGQGQSMAGSLLNLICLAGDSSAASWDLRYILSRWLYSVGLGIASWLLIRHLGSACLVSLVGVFIGFFGYRLNHMAQLSLDISPWILVGWALLKDRPGARAAMLLFLANWELMTSGTVKEAYILMVGLNLTGMLIVLLSDLTLRERLVRLCIASVTGVCLILISAPLWLIFLDALGAGVTSYDAANVQQMVPWRILGFFDEMFYRRFQPNEGHALPAINFALFAGCIWTFVRADQVWKEKASVALLLVLLPCAFLVFGILPSALLMRIPFINSIYHIHNTFSCVMIVVATVLAGFGFKAVWLNLHAADWWRRCAEFGAVAAVFFLVYHGTAESPPGSVFFWGVWGALSLSLIIGHLALYSWRKTRRVGLLVVGLGGALVLSCWQNSQYLHSPFDQYVTKLGARANLRPHSEAVDYINSELAKEPARVAGLGNTVFGGYPTTLRWESIYGVEAVGNPWFEAFCDAADIKKKDWVDSKYWHEDNLPFILPIQNLFNIRYYLAPPASPPAEINGLRWVASRDLNVYESPGVWPRAFFTDHYVTYTIPPELVSLLRQNSDGRPFAALTGEEIAPELLPFKGSDLSSRVVKAATNFLMTANTTQFIIDAPAAGLAVLAENYLPKDFRAFVNEKQVSYFQVNEVCKGVLLPSAGTFKVRFEYWPARLNLALGLAGLGIVIAAFLLGARFYHKRRGDVDNQDGRVSSAG